MEFAPKLWVRNGLMVGRANRGGYLSGKNVITGDITRPIKTYWVVGSRQARARAGKVRALQDRE